MSKNSISYYIYSVKLVHSKARGLHSSLAYLTMTNAKTHTMYIYIKKLLAEIFKQKQEYFTAVLLCDE